MREDRLRPWSGRGAMVMGGAGLVGVGLVTLGIKTLPLAMMLVGLLASAGLIWSKHLGPQLLARAAWWAALVFGSLGLVLLMIFSGQGSIAPEHRVTRTLWQEIARLAPMASVALGGLVALLGAGRLGLEAKSKWFDPRQGRGALMASLILGVSDASTLAVMGTLLALNGKYAQAWGPGLAAAVMFGALWGLYRLRVWGLVAVMIANIAIAGLAVSGALGSSLFWASPLFMLTAVLQLLLPQRLLRLIRRGMRGEEEAVVPEEVTGVTFAQTEEVVLEAQESAVTVKV